MALVGLGVTKWNCDTDYVHNRINSLSLKQIPVCPVNRSVSSTSVVYQGNSFPKSAPDYKQNYSI